ncbi:hypothetical protein AB3G45_24370 [Shinella sp. S4-D37]|jgi:predicted RNA polymerase sigma factor|uniref:hypothetical protein n=1 Tax=Shinella sp. S4-D37 TaxID=3161999 RepID=UPI00346614CB
MDIMEINARYLAKYLPDLDVAERAVMEPYLRGLETWTCRHPVTKPRLERVFQFGRILTIS